RTLAGHAPGDRFGHAVADAGDVDADGIHDIIVGAAQAAEGESSGWGGYGPGYAQVYSGADGALLHTWQGEYGLDTDFDSFGRVVLGIGDVNGDGHDDVAVSERDAEVELLHDSDPVGGRVWVFSGLDGSVLQRIEDVGPTLSHLGWGLGRAGDLDADGTPDLIIGGPKINSSPVQVVVVSGATWAPILQFATTGTYTGMSVAGTGDVDGDLVPDILAAGSYQGALYSGADGSLLFQTQALAGIPSYNTLSVTAVGDLDQDGLPDWVVGVPGSTGVATQAGAVYAYSSATGQKLGMLFGSQPGGRLGWSVAPAGDHDGDGTPDVLVGVPGYDGAAGADSGRVAIQRALASKSHLSLYNPTGNFNQFGIVSACAGDVDSDGFADVLSGTASDSTAAFSAGRVDVFSGRDGSSLHTFLGDQSNDRLGWSVAAAGDADADGYADVISGAPLPTATTGPAYARLWSGRTGALLHQFNGVSVGDQFGLAVAGLGDIDHDGHDDVAISATQDDTAGSNFGAVRLYSGRTSGLLRFIPGTQSSAEFGCSVAGAGDVDLDGTPDVIVGARLHATVNGTSSGSASVYSGATGALLFHFIGPSSFDNAGWSVAGAGDVDGDGRPDLAVGIPFADGALPDTGIVAVYSGLDGSLISAITSMSGPVGQAVSGIDDVDGDGLPDIVVGVPTADDDQSDCGAVRIHSGQSGELINSHPGPAASDGLGYSVDASGDVDNDGRPDIVAGAIGSALDPGNQGAIYAISILGPPTPWQSEGKPLPGTHGAPKLAASGTLEPGEPVSVSLSNALQNSTATLVVGAFALNAPFKGGTMVPFPQFLVFGLPTGPAGSLVLAAPWPAGLPGGATLHFQYWIGDPAAPAGL
ncbi:MAG TPA: FG-GAP-like repeat-containing protein, partial [Planctomycetota bacterium]|nr:FG-GAP-like repeat-containing protein [Planctomycetota bacterium]